jgi:hypothetical protein
MKPLIGAAALAVLAASAADGPPRLKPVSYDAPYRAYWLTGPGEQAGYLTLLVTHGPVEGLAGHEKWSDFPLDNMAMTFRAYKKDSLWDSPFKPVLRFGEVDPAERTAVLDGVAYSYEGCDLKDVVRLLEKPFGTIPISRISHPIRGAEHTAKAFRLLLLEQMDREKE